MREDAIVEAAAGVHLVHGSNTNWVVLSEGDAVTLIDTGYPGDRQDVLASLDALGHAPEAVSAVLITHAHNDHLGSAEYLSSTFGIPVHLHEAELPHARREFLHQVSVGQVMRQAWRPGVLPWAVHALRSGGKTDVRMTRPEAFPAAGPLDLPGRPVPVHTPGHTAGHCVYHLPDAGILISGDALVSGHPTSRIRGPQLLPAMFDTDRAGALASLQHIEALAADVLLPGHGPLHRGPLLDAVQRAREPLG
ncbi:MULTISPECIES: MBL fold metallo-hydrolase [Streptomyces]|uniref:MBL fold metallo-hydrolase n=1 Tax=Streptomyces dengpaensis TaxID=2049881 RepID=A0ABN5IEW2_9ACTN|nr:MULTISPECIES: MBL fold metallo-hydrolase [Streptomyces]AVH61636.1 MBL fold metallo-hydrolase [Streptomyces dengpaensis]PIB07709.1 MBL fold metallo-hydrolase [Streptomyces sp. HG99]